MRLFFHKHKKTTQQGFSLVEFVVILTVFSVMAGISFFNFRGFESSVTLTNLAHDIALTIRQAQVLGISASGESIVGNSSQVRGAHFSYNATEQVFEKTFTIFSDVDENGRYSSDTDIIIDQIRINTNDAIVGINVGDNEGDTRPIDEPLDITFQRPDPTAYIRSGRVSTPANYAEIIVADPTGEQQRTVQVFKNGRISVRYE